MAEETQVEKITVGEAVGFWQSNKSWIIPVIAALGGILGGANGDKLGGLLPQSPDIPAINKRLDADEARITVVEAKIGVTPPATDTKKNDPSSQDGVIHIPQ